MSAFPYTRTWAAVTLCGRYRYELGRDWALAENPGAVLWIMLNPSTADGHSDDATIRLCRGYSARWGYSGLRVVNLFAWRATYPAALEREAGNGVDIVGERNAEYLERNARTAALIVAAWGSSAPVSATSQRWNVLGKLRRLGVPLHYLKLNEPTRAGQVREPAHPRGLRRDLRPIPWDYLPDCGPGAGA